MLPGNVKIVDHEVFNIPVTDGAMTSKDQLRPLNSRLSLVVFSEVADGRAMVSADPRWYLVVSRWLLRPFGHGVVFGAITNC